MSYDRELNQVCPHMVAEEPLSFLDDLKTIRPLRPIAAINSVRIRYNGEAYLPSTGLYVPAQATSMKAGPYNIQGGVSDRLVIRADSGPYQTLTLPSGNKVPVEQIAERLNQLSRGLVFSATSKRQLRIKSSRIGPSASISVRAEGSTAASILSLAVDRSWKGQTVTPGWSIVNDPNTLSDRPTRLIVFDEPLKGLDNYVELDYTTVRQECRRCGGLGIENDWRYDGEREVVTVQNEDLLLQEMLKVTYTVKGSNPFYLWYGTSIVESIGKKLVAGGVVQNLIISDIYEAFRRWQSIKKDQEEKVGQKVTDEEYPFRLLSVNLTPSAEDPTVIFIDAFVQNRSLNPIQISRGFRIPTPNDLLST